MRKDKEIDPDETGGFTGFYLRDVLEAVYFLYGVGSQDTYKVSGGIKKLLAGIKEAGERTEEYTRVLDIIKPSNAVWIIPCIVEIMGMEEGDLELLRGYANSPDFTERRNIEKQIRDNYPMQQSLLKDIGIG